MKTRLFFAAILFTVIAVSCQKEPISTLEPTTSEQVTGNQNNPVDNSGCSVQITVPAGCKAELCGVGGTGTYKYTCPQGNVLTTTGDVTTVNEGTATYTVSGAYVVVKLQGDAGGTFTIKSLTTGHSISRNLTTSSRYFVASVNPNSCITVDFTECLP